MFLGLICFLALHIRQISVPYYPRYDSGAYLVSAVSLAQGKGLTEINHPEEPAFVLYPPLYPVFLAPQIWLFGLNYAALRIHLLFLFLLLLFLTWRTFPPPMNVWGVFLLCISNLALYAGRIQGELPLAFLFTLYLFLERKHSKRWWTFAVLAAMPLIKPIGLVPVAAAGLDSVFSWAKDRKAWRPALYSLLVPLPFVLWTLWAQPNLLHPSRTPLLADTWTGDVQHTVSPVSTEMIRRAGENFWRLIDEIVPQGFAFVDAFHHYGNSHVHLWFAGLFVLAGIPLLFRFKRIYGLIVLVHLALLCTLPTLTPRYIAIFLPLYVFSACLIISLTSRVWKFLPGLILLSGGSVILFVSLTYPRELDLWTTASATAITAHTADLFLPSRAVVLVNDPYGFYLVTGRKTLPYLRSEQKSPPEHFLSRYTARRGKITHGAVFSYEYKKFLDVIQRYHLRARPLREINHVILVDLHYENR